MFVFRRKHLMFGLALAGFADLAQAAGFALIEQNASGLGNAYAGAAAVAGDASTIFFNPAGMTRLPGRQIVVVGHLIKPQAEFSGTVSPAIGGGTGGDAGSWSFVPNGYFAYRLTPKVHLGVGLNSPFGLKTEYGPGWMGRYQAIKSEVKTVNLNPSIAYKLSDTLSLGAGLNIQRIEAVLTSLQPLGAPPAPTPLVTIKGDDYGWGYNLGALWQATPATRIGLSYRSEVAYTLEGTSSTSNPSVTSLNGPVTADITLPASASLSLFHTLSSQWDLLADVTWTGWSSFDRLPIQGTVNKTTPENWQDILRYSLGATWHMSDKLSLRGGLAYDEAPVSDRYRTPRIPDGARTWVALGGQYRLSGRGALDFGYAHLFVNSPELQSTDNGTTLNGQYDSQVDILSVQYTHGF
ncbi:MAG: OmpP1/FadL family transporter [Thiobacillus sp.]